MSGSVLISGGAGYIGTELASLLLEAGYKVTIYDCLFFDRTPLSHLENHPNLRIVEGDIRNEAQVGSLLAPGMDVVHLASLSNDPSCDLNPRWSHEVNYTASVNLAKAAKRAGCSRFCYASSCSVYGYGGAEKLKETSLCSPVSLYAELKLKAEQEILAMADAGFHPISLRQATVFGLSRRMRFDLAINQMTMFALTRGKIFVLGGGQQWRPFLHVRDAAACFKAMLEAPTKQVSGQVFNVGSDENNFMISNLAKRVKQEIPSTEIEVVPDDADRRDYNVDFSKIRAMLGFRPSVGISQGIAEIRDYILANKGKDFHSSEYFNVKRVKESGARLLDSFPATRMKD